MQRRSPAAACGRSPRTWENFHCGSWEGRGSGRPEDEEEEVGDGDGAMELEFVPRRRLPAAPLIVAAYRIMYREWISCTVSTTAVLWFLSIRSGPLACCYRHLLLVLALFLSESCSTARNLWQTGPCDVSLTCIIIEVYKRTGLRRAQDQQALGAGKCRAT